MFSKLDEDLIAAKGIDLAEIADQLKKFKQGIPSIKLSEPATIGNGLLHLSNEEETLFLATFNDFTGSVSKFVPASGAATRMFKHLFEFKETYDGSEAEYEKLHHDKGPVWEFFEKIASFAFFPLLRKAYHDVHGSSLEEALVKGKYVDVLDVLLSDKGLNYGKLPKGLLMFHSYPVSNRVAAHEQLIEGLGYATKSAQLNIHFTVSKEHQLLFENAMVHTQKELEDTQLHVSYSVQKESTDTLAVDKENNPFRDGNGQLLFRPAGHGALLENLNELEEEIVFIKNIDNVVPDNLKPETIKYKKIIAGVLITYQRKIFDLLTANEKGEDIHKQGHELLSSLGIKGAFTKEEVIDKLNRPIRVCGMVRNEGEPGGGPFWVDHGNYESLQIVEGAQIDQTDTNQTKILKASTHFNPVDIVCGIYNYEGKKFDLLRHRDINTGFITNKSSAGKQLKAMELPGLWNGSMSDWNTIFVEVPLITFNPVKTINDLLRKQHQ